MRVVRPGGWLMLAWNERDETVPWVKTFGDVMERHAGGRPYTREGDVAPVLRAAGLQEVSNARLDHHLQTTKAGVVERAASTSYVAAMPVERREAALAEVAALVEGFGDPFPFPHVTDVYLARVPPRSEPKESLRGGPSPS